LFSSCFHIVEFLNDLDISGSQGERPPVRLFMFNRLQSYVFFLKVGVNDAVNFCAFLHFDN
jgi:hypothetical protein